MRKYILLSLMLVTSWSFADEINSTIVTQQIDGVIGYCHATDPGPVTHPESAVYSLHPATTASYLSDSNKNININKINQEFESATVTVLESPSHGVLVGQQNTTDYHPNPDYRGDDQVVFLVVVAGYKIKVVYYIYVGAIGNATVSEDCPGNELYWEIPMDEVVKPLPTSQSIMASAENGDVKYQLKLAKMYQRGQGGMTQNFELAAKWYTKAAEQGDMKAQAQLVSMYTRGQYDGEGIPANKKMALMWAAKAAEQGDERSQDLLAKMYYEKGDYTNAVVWYTKSAEQNNWNSQVLLAEMYKNGDKVKQDYKLAIEWYIRAAENSVSWATYEVADLYLNGVGVKNYKKAYIWFSVSNDSDHTDTIKKREAAAEKLTAKELEEATEEARKLHEKLSEPNGC